MQDKTKEILRFWGIIFCLLIIFSSGLYSCYYAQKHFLPSRDYLSSPGIKEERAIVLSNCKVMAMGPGYFMVKKGDIERRVEGDVPGLKAGDIITLKGIFNKEGYISLRDYYVSAHRNLKIMVSCFTVIFCFFYFLSNFRFDRKNFTFAEKPYA